MNKLIFIFIVIPFIFACKRPETKKSAEQKIETPAMKLSQPPEKFSAPEEIQKETQPPAAVAESLPRPRGERASQTVVKANSNIEIIIDASGSMNGLIGTVVKIDALKEGLKNIVDTPLPPEMAKRKLAFRTFGNKSLSDKNDCTDTHLDASFEKQEPGIFKDALKNFSPKGVAPIAFALEEASADFSESAETADNMIVLIADGLDSCNGNIIAAAERLHRSSSKVIIDVIGFDVDQKAADELKKVAESASGHFYLARSDVELYSALDQAVNSTLPYNLRIKAVSGASPIPSSIVVYRANTQSVVERAETSGIKFFKLPAGSYDVMVQYTGSVETTKPSKIIKGVEVQATTKSEQVVQFELGGVNLRALDQNGKESTANFYFRKSGAEEMIGRLMKAVPPAVVFLTPGKYDIDAESAEPDTIALTASLKEVEVTAGETVEKELKFLTGKLILKAQNVAKKEVPIKYRITKPGSEEEITSGEGTLEGATIDLPPGNYDAYVTWVDPNVQGAAETKLASIAIKGGESLEQLAVIVTGTLKLSGKDSQNKFVHTEYSIKQAGKSEEVLHAISEEAPQEVFISPGIYDITAINTTSKIIPAPSVIFTNISIKEGQNVNLDAVFKLGTLKLIGKNAKDQKIPATFTIYRAGLDEALVTEASEKEFVTFNLTPGLYDVKAEDSAAKTDPKPSVWFHDVMVEEKKEVAKEAVFTSGKLKLICRGKNNAVLECEFNVFTYGSDTALFSGKTEEDWKEFDIPPGRYYMEAGWHDPVEEQLLKKWINVSIGENQIVEQILRF